MQFRATLGHLNLLQVLSAQLNLATEGPIQLPGILGLPGGSCGVTTPALFLTGCDPAGLWARLPARGGLRAAGSLPGSAAPLCGGAAGGFLLETSACIAPGGLPGGALLAGCWWALRGEEAGDGGTSTAGADAGELWQVPPWLVPLAWMWKGGWEVGLRWS